MATRNQKRLELRNKRVEAIFAFVQDGVDRQVLAHEMSSLTRLSDQTLHLLCAAIDNTKR